MADQHNNMDRGTLQRNKYKTANDRKPDYKGKIILSVQSVQALADKLNAGDEAALLVAGWVMESQYGRFLSLRLDLPQVETNTPRAPQRGASRSQEPITLDSSPLPGERGYVERPAIRRPVPQGAPQPARNSAPDDDDVPF